MTVRKRASKKAKKGFTYTVDFRYKDKYGVSRRFTKSGFLTSREAKNYEIEKRTELAQGLNITNKKITFGYVADQYFKNDPFLKETTLEQRKGIYNKHLKPSLSNIEMNLIDYKLLQDIFDILGKNNSKQVCKNTYTTLNAIYVFAINNKIVYLKPYEKLKISGLKTEKKEKEVITQEEFNALISHFKKPTDKLRLINDNYIVLLYIGYYCGLRLSEALALERKDIDFNNNTISINKQIQDIKGIATVTSTKTDKSNSIIPLPKELKELLIEHFRTYSESNLVIFNKKYTYLLSHSVKQRFLSLSKKLGFKFHYHMLRHTFITQLHSKGIDVKTAQELARHSNYQTTMDVYTNLDKNKMVGITDDLYS